MKGPHERAIRPGDAPDCVATSAPDQHLGECDSGDCPWDLDGDGHVGQLDVWTLLLHIGDCG